MKRLLILLISMIFCGLLSAAGFPYANPALNPVEFRNAPHHQDLPLVRNGRLNFVIAGDFERERTARYKQWRSVTLAAEALADAFERTTGHRPQVVAADSPSVKEARFVIALGETPFSRKLGLKPLALPKEAFVVQSFERGVIIAGHDGSFLPGSYHDMDWNRYRLNGTLNGAYDFIERILGVRYYYPGIGIVAPAMTDLTLSPVSYYDEPYFRNRYNYAWPLEFRRKWPWKNIKKANPMDYAWRLGMSTRFNEVCHSPNPHYLLATYPELKKEIFFTDRTGYTYYNPSTHIGNLLDVTNPRLAVLLVESFKKYYDSNGRWNGPWCQKNRFWYPPNSEYVLFGQADTYVRDLNNERTRHLFPASRPADCVSDLYMNFYIQIAKALKKELPGKRLGVLAYHNYTLPPVVCTDIPDNIDVQVCAGRFVQAKSEVMQKYWKDLFQAWYEVLGRRQVTAWTYGAQSNEFTQAIQGRYLKDYVRLLRPYLSRHGFIIDAGGLKYHYYYSYYLSYRTLWNPDFDIDAALNEHWALLYGAEAGRYLKAFYDLLVERWEKVYIARLNREMRKQTNPSPERLYEAFNIPAVDKLEKLLQQARAATRPGSVERMRVEYFARPWGREFQGVRAYCTQITPVYEIKQLGRRDQITVDGNCREKIWKNAPVMELKDARGTGASLVSHPQAKLLWDKTGIYIGFSAQGTPQINKGDVFFNSDNIEIFLSPGTEKENYYQFAISPTNDFHDAYKVEKPIEAALDSKWSAVGIKRAVTMTENSWSAEIYIPFAALHRTSVPRAYSTWFGNLVNNKLDQEKKPIEYSSFAITMGNNHNHALWGKFKFMGKGD